MLHVGELLGSNIEVFELSTELLLVLLSMSAFCRDVELSIELESGDFEYWIEFGLFPEVSESVR